MKRQGNLWPRLVAFENLWLAWRRARKGKSRSVQVGLFELDLERNLLSLQRELREGGYLPGAYRLFTIYERKPRQIAAAPLRDRVVHHAAMNLIEPPLDARFIADSYACRRGKGTHRAVDRYQAWARRYPYVLKHFRRLRGENGYRFRRRLKGLARAYAEGRIGWDRIDPSVRAWIGHAANADTLGLRKTLLGGVSFKRGSGP